MLQLHEVLVFSICIFILSRIILNFKRRKLSDLDEIKSGINTAMILSYIIAFGIALRL